MKHKSGWFLCFSSTFTSEFFYHSSVFESTEYPLKAYQYRFRITEKTALEMCQRGVTKDDQSQNSCNLQENIKLIQRNLVFLASWTRFRQYMKIINHDVNDIFAVLECYAAQFGCLVADLPGSIGFPETSETNYQYTLSNIPEERRYHLQSGGSLKSCVIMIISLIRKERRQLRRFIVYVVVVIVVVVDDDDDDMQGWLFENSRLLEFILYRLEQQQLTLRSIVVPPCSEAWQSREWVSITG